MVRNSDLYLFLVKLKIWQSKIMKMNGDNIRTIFSYVQGLVNLS